MLPAASCTLRSELPVVCLDPFAPRAPAGDHTRSRLLLAWHAEHTTEAGSAEFGGQLVGRQQLLLCEFPKGLYKDSSQGSIGGESYLYDRVAQ